MAHKTRNMILVGVVAFALAACGGGGGAGAGAPAPPQGGGWTLSGQAGGAGGAATLGLSGTSVVIFLADGTRVEISPGPDGRFTVFLPGGTTLKMGLVIEGDLRRLVVTTSAGVVTDVIVLGPGGGTIDFGALEMVAGHLIPALNPLRRLDTDGDGIVDFTDVDFSPPPFLDDGEGWSVHDRDRDGWDDWDLDRDGWSDGDSDRDGWLDGDIDRDGWHDSDTDRDGWIDEACARHPEWCADGGPPPGDLFCAVFTAHPDCVGGAGDFCLANPDHEACSAPLPDLICAWFPGSEGCWDGAVAEFCAAHPDIDACQPGGEGFCLLHPDHDSCGLPPPPCHPDDPECAPDPPCDPTHHDCEPPPCDPSHPDCEPPPPCDPGVEHCDPPHPPPHPCDPETEGDCHRLWTEFLAPHHGTWHRGRLELVSLAGSLPRLHAVAFAVDERFLCPQPAHPEGIPYTCVVPTPEFADGPHLLRSIAHGTDPDDIAVDHLEVGFDNTPPRIALVEPPDGSVVGTPFVLVAHAEDNLALDHVVFRFDGHEACVVPAHDGDTYRCEWHAPPGEHHWSAAAFDRAGNGADTEPRRLWVDGDVCIPELPECGPPPPPCEPDTPDCEPPHPPDPSCDPELDECARLWAQIAGPLPESWHRGPMEVHGFAGDLPRLAGVSFHVGDTPVCEAPGHADGPYGCLVHTPEFPDGLHHLVMVAHGHLHGDLADDGIPVWFDNTPPELLLEAPAPGAVVGTPFALVARAADNLALSRVLFLFDGHPACEIPAGQDREVYECLWEAPAGEHHWTAMAFDRAGNLTGAEPRALFVEG